MHAREVRIARSAYHRATMNEDMQVKAAPDGERISEPTEAKTVDGDRVGEPMEANATVEGDRVGESMEAQAAIDGEREVGAPAAKPAGYPFSVLRVLGTALRVTKRNFVPFFVLACVLEAPGFLLGQFGHVRENFAITLPVTTITGALMSAVVMYGVIMELHGSRPSTGMCIEKGFGQLVRVLGVTIVSTLAIGGATLLLVIPGIVVALMLYVVVPVTVVEDVGIGEAMKRSRDLTAGRKSDLFLIAVLSVAISAVIEWVALTQLEPEAAIAWRGITSALSKMFFAVTTAVVYVELRKLRDGTQIPELATAVARIRN